MTCQARLSTCSLLLLAVLGACKDEDVVPGSPGAWALLDQHGLNPYPSMHLMAADSASATGYRLDFPDGALPQSEEGTPLDLVRLARLDGFSVANTALVLLEEAEIDASSLPSADDLGASLEQDASVQIIDLATGDRVPLFAELDAHEACTGPQDRSLLIRPLQALDFTTRYAVVLTGALKTESGSSYPAPERFAALRDGGAAPAGLEGWVAHYEALFRDLEAAGLARDELVLAWDFHTGSEAVTHAQADHVLEATRQDLPSEATLEPSYTVESFYDSEAGDTLNEHAWRQAWGYFELESFLAEEGAFELDAEGLPVPQGADDIYYMVLLPSSVREAAAGSVPVLVFGHGLLSAPAAYLAYEDDPNAVQALADNLGMAVIATKWRGLTTDDLAAAVDVANDFGTFHHLTEKMIQGLANAAALPRLLRTQFAQAEFFQAPDGSGSLLDTERIYYFGISLGGIQGANLMANSQELDYGVLHASGAIWSTMLERSSNWPTFELQMEYGVPAPEDRQLLYAISQLHWDAVDPITHVADLQAPSILWQESVGDEQVPNMTTEALVRSVGAPLITPAVNEPFDLDLLAAPLGPGSTAMMQFDPQLGTPPDENRPAEDTGAHTFIRHTQEVHDQAAAFFAAGAEGSIVHPCGKEPCVFDDGDWDY